MNKKGLSTVISTALLVVLTVVVTGVVWIVVNYNFNTQPEFTITKEECRNETRYLYIYNCSDGTLRIDDREQFKEIVLNNGVRCFGNNHTWEKTICEQKEVEEIEFNYDYLKEIPRNICLLDDEIKDTLPDKEGYGCLCTKENCSFEIKRNDLTTEFLKENCEGIINEDTYCPNLVKCRENCEGWKDRNMSMFNRCHDSDCFRDCEFSKYKCGAYQIEVKE